MLRSCDAFRASSALPSLAMALALGLATQGCAGTIKSRATDDGDAMVDEDDQDEGADDGDAGPPIFTDDALDASPTVPPRAGDGGVRGDGGDAGTTRTAAGPAAMCGAVRRADGHPPFAAIQKLATTTDEVRVLVYGQSISEQAWWTRTKAWLETAYPNARLVMEEHARGGCAAQCLIGHAPWSDGRQYNRLPEDVFAWRPDLIIFHVYGDDSDYRYIMRAFKEGCAAFDDYKTFDGQEVAQVKCTAEQRAMSAGYRPAEVLVQNDFPNSAAMLQPCPASYAPGDNWPCHMNEKVLPQQVAQHGFALQDNFHAWPRHIAERNVSLRALVADDDTHLREPGGTDLMFEMTVPHLCY